MAILYPRLGKQIASLLLACSLGFSVRLHAQIATEVLPDSPGSAQISKAPIGPAQGEPAAAKQDFEKAMNVFEHDWIARFGRAFEYDFQRVEQPSILITGSGTITPNPEHYLNEHTLKFQFLELFPSAASLATDFKSACDFLKDRSEEEKKAGGASECGNEKRVMRIATAGGWWARALSGITVATDLSERPVLQQGVVVTNSSFSNHYQVSGAFDYDPSQLFLGSSNWKNLPEKDRPCESEEAASTAGNAPRAAAGRQPSASRRADCIRWLAAPRLLAPKLVAGHYPSSPPNKGIEVLAAFVPTFSFKRVSQFDFIKSGGILVPTSYLETAQNQFTFRWDLKRAIPNSASRNDAVVASKKNPSSKLCVVVSGGAKSYINVSPEFKPEKCAAFARNGGADEYALGCVTDDGISIGTVYPRDQSPMPEKDACWKEE